MKFPKRVATFLCGCLFLLILPLSANAGTVKIEFNINSSSLDIQVNDSFLSFDDTGFNLDTWYSISGLSGLDWKFGVFYYTASGQNTWFVDDVKNTDVWSDSQIKIINTSPGEYNVLFQNDSGDDLYSATLASLSTMTASTASLNGTGLLNDNSIDWDTTLWVSTDSELIAQAAPLPSSAMLLIAAVVPAVGLIRRRQV